ncbi:hypothetical protein [Streptomyces sp. NBC_00342]|uniref:hypothetical protein n=1 Tax=Streptomyces sp. NBC_00342 TaxID=2975718 RepID=UPI002E2B1B20|nr:hypothetical protein [Streptomyces sp. NBC_00342]
MRGDRGGDGQVVAAGGGQRTDVTGMLSPGHGLLERPRPARGDRNPAASFTVDSDTRITATAPAGMPGTVDVTVTTAGGASTVSAADQFACIAPTADIDGDVTAHPHLGILVPSSAYPLTARNTGPDALTLGNRDRRTARRRLRDGPVHRLHHQHRTVT